jgi:hypothetical protein
VAFNNNRSIGGEDNSLGKNSGKTLSINGDEKINFKNSSLF